ncbi:hypothetical protein JHFBIEKO_3087 [Methylobacterium mesophilicum]|uniref:hypothetical protein n=1 Tax=Methylobacterium mesophilicum TaxID=39956 RepID=UPI001EE2D902|nr:hypothetical protein [Methylobacterium mesophilicum]GJE22631.1 hypothetical protein JHFBIEKO_3087 [Methylobacterium mesophilicum]
MSDGPNPAHEHAAIQHMMRRLDEFARGLGLDEATTRQIVEKVATGMVDQSDEERMMEARQRMLIASA